MIKNKKNKKKKKIKMMSKLIVPGDQNNPL